MVSIAVLFGIVGLSHAGVVEATSPVFGLSLKHDGVRQSVGAETLTYSSQWDGGEGARRPTKSVFTFTSIPLHGKNFSHFHCSPSPFT